MSEKEEALPANWVVWLLWSSAVLFCVLLAFVTWRTWAASAPLCDPRFPVRRDETTSWIFVLGAVAAFSVGHFSGQLAIRRERRSEKALGDGPWTSPAGVVAVQAGVAVFLFLVTALMLVEAWTLAHHAWPLTYYTRCADGAGGPISFLGASVYAFVIGRWLWVFETG